MVIPHHLITPRFYIVKRKMGFWGSLSAGISTFADKALGGSKWVVEKLSLKTDHHLKGDAIRDEKADKLTSAKRSAVRSVSSAVTGIVLNTVLAVACPVFIVPAVISTIQLGVSATNCHRARREIKRRRVEAPSEVPAKSRKRDMVLDITIGATIKTAFTAIGAGIVGIDNIADNFVQLAHKAGEHLVTQYAGDAIASNGVNESISHVSNHAQGLAAKLQVSHPNVFKGDSVIHKMIGVLEIKPHKAFLILPTFKSIKQRPGRP